MTEETRKTGFSNGWKQLVMASICLIVVVAFGVGFLLLPGSQKARGTFSMHAAVQHALGHAMHNAAPAIPASDFDLPTDIVWDEPTIHAALNGNARKGEHMAISCSVCHGDRGIAGEVWIPTLAGVDRMVLYKELADFRTGRRLSGPMSAIAQSLTLQQSADLAAYFSTLPGIRHTTDTDDSGPSVRSYRAKDPTIRLVYAGDPKRGIPGCSTCHGPGTYRLGVPGLTGQNAGYLDDQLSAFAQATRRNDMNMPMRTIAQLLTASEREALAKYYAQAPLDPHLAEVSLDQK